VRVSLARSHVQLFYPWVAVNLMLIQPGAVEVTNNILGVKSILIGALTVLDACPQIFFAAKVKVT
jgi:hypothetical protein